jgi:hypothetical protein
MQSGRFAGILALATCFAGCSSIVVEPGRSVVLEPEAVSAFSKMCSRPGIPDFTATWQPDQTAINSLEADLARLHRLRAEGCCILGASVGDVNRYYRQYVGIVSGGRRLIYVNAYAADESTRLESKPVNDWCDGGDAFWGVLYDVETRRFSELAFNGIA